MKLIDRICESLRKRGWKRIDRHHEICADVGPTDMIYYLLTQNDDGTVHITDSGSDDKDIDCGNHRTVTSAIIAMRILVGPNQDQRLRASPEGPLEVCTVCRGPTYKGVCEACREWKDADLSRNQPSLKKNVDYIDRFGDES